MKQNHALIGFGFEVRNLVVNSECHCAEPFGKDEFASLPERDSSQRLPAK
jgi:hypothetical protein